MRTYNMAEFTTRAEWTETAYYKNSDFLIDWFIIMLTVLDPQDS